MHPTDALDLITEHIAYGESDPEELPDSVDDLLHLRSILQDVRNAALQVRKSVDEKIGATLGPGVFYEYGENVVSWRHGYRWKAIPDAARAFIEQYVTGEDVLDLFPVTAMRKTGLEKVAARYGFVPKVAVETVLEKKWDEAPSIQVKPKEVVVKTAEMGGRIDAILDEPKEA